MILLKYLRVQALKQLRNVEIWFPRRGTLLIEGHNEAGKSTLFEAIYFGLYGAPLVGEESRATFDDLIPHDAARASVTLVVTTPGCELEIKRVLLARDRKKVSHEARLTVRRQGEAAETLHGARAVNDRILQELSGLDGDALRNSCFMEQRALDRVENLNRAQRESAVARLLGLERLKSVEDAMRAEMNNLRRMADRGRAELAVAHALQAAQRAARRERDALERLHATRAIEIVRQRDVLLTQQHTETGILDSLAQERFQFQQRIDRAERAHQLVDIAQAADNALSRAQDKEAEVQAQRATLAELERIERQDLPRLRERERESASLDAHLTELETLRERATSEQARDAARAAVAAARTDVDEAEASLRSAQETLRQAEQAMLLMRWVRRKEIAQQTQKYGEQVDRVAAELNHATTSEREARAALRRNQTLLAVTAALSIFALGAGTIAHIVWAASVLGAVVCVTLLSPYIRARRAWTQTASILRQTVDKHMRATLERDAAQRIESQFGDIQDLGSSIRQLESDVPSSLTEVENLVAHLQAAEAIPPEDARLKVEYWMARSAEARASLRIAEQRLAEFAPVDSASVLLHGEDPDVLEAAIMEEVAGLGIEPDRHALATYRGTILAQIAQLEARLMVREKVRGALNDTEHEIEALRREGVDTLQECLDQAASLTLGTEWPDVTSLEAMRVCAAQLRERAHVRLVELDDRTARAELARLDERERQARIAQSDICGEYDRLAAALGALLAERGYTLDGPISQIELERIWPAAMDAANRSIEIAQAEWEDARVQARVENRQAAELATAHDLVDRELDVDVCQNAAMAAERDLRRHEAAVEMAQEVRARIVRRVMPETAAYMRALLPQLTAGRYRDVQLHGEDGDGADLRIRVWDSSAGRYVAKNLFSGGMRDQTSLALRLSFALATLPKELGATPGFIFLDEPLSSFDDERTQALVDVLTNGEIAQRFAQVVLISHSRSFDRSQFMYRLRLASGRITESNLPAEKVAMELWSAESAILGPLA